MKSVGMPTIMESMYQLLGFKRLSARAVIALLFVVVFVVTSVLVWRTYDAVHDGRESQTELVTSANYISVLEDIRAQYLNEWLLLVSAQPPYDQAFIQEFDDARSTVDSAFARLIDESAGFGAEEQEHSREMAARHAHLMGVWTSVVAQLVQQTPDGPRDVLSLGPLQESADLFAELTTEINDNRERLNQTLRDDQISRSEWEKTALLVGLVWLGTLGGAVYATHRWVLKPLEGVGQATRLIAAGDVDALAPIHGPAEVASLATDVNRMAMSLINRSNELNSYLSKNLESRTADLEALNDALRSSEARLNAVIDNAPLIMLALAKDGTCTLSKGRGLAACGIEAGAIDGMSVFEILGENETLRADFERALQGDSFGSEALIAGLTFESHFAPLIAPDGSFQGVMFVAVEVTDRLRAQEALRRSEELYRDLFENAKDIIYTYDLNGRFTSINKAGQIVSGYSEREIKTRAVSDLLSPDTRERALEIISSQLNGQESSATYEVELIAKNGTAIPLEVSARLIHDDGTIVGVQGIARDIRERRRADVALRTYAQELEALYGQLATTHADLANSQRELEEKSRLLERALELEREQSRIDSLTGALNHGGIVQVLREVVSDALDGSRAAVIMVDIDGMKAANDMYGHQFGDQVLIQVKEALTRHGAVVGRYGGDEFVAVLAGADEVAAEAYRQEVLQTVARAGLKDPEAGTDLAILVSIGFAVYPRDAQRIEELIALADSAMYEHKRRRLVGALEANTRRMGGDHAVRLIGEIVPVLTSPGDLRERLAIVCRQLAVDCAYDRVEIIINPSGSAGQDVVVAYPPGPADIEEPWQLNRNGYSHGQTLRTMLERMRRPIIVDRPQEDESLSELQQDVLRLTGSSSVMIAPLLWEGRLIGALMVASLQPDTFGPIDAQFLMGVASQVSSIVSMSTFLREFGDRASKLSAAHREGVMLLAWVADTQGGVPSHNFERLRAVSENLARELGYSAEEADQIGLAAMLHDVGKYRVPGEILARPQNLSEREWEVVKRHTIWGSRLLQGHPGFALASQVARWHHERWDGAGYPDGLAGDEIPVPAAIASVADALDAMVYDRVYHQGMSLKTAFEELIAGAGSQFSPTVIDALIRLYKRGDLPLIPHMSSNRSIAA